MTANDSSSSVTGRAEAPAVTLDLLAAGRLAPIPSALLRGEAEALLSPLRWLPGPAAAADLCRPPGHRPDRRDLARELAETNRAYGHPAASDLGRKLADPDTLVVVTGQQPGLFGGPLYAFSKAVAAARWAAHLEAAGRPAVAVFWVATEDHDFAEVARSTFIAPDGLLDLDLGDDPDPLLPVGMRALGPRVEGLLERLREAIPGERFAAWTEILGQWYRPSARFGEAFPRLLVHLLGDRSPLMLDSMSPALKRAQAPWLERLLRQRGELGGALAAADERVQGAGFELQVAPQPGLSPLFLLRGGERRRIEWLGEDGYRLRGGSDEERPVDELYEILRDNPGVLSPGVLARPAIQDAVLGTALQVLGPGELSYMVQAAAVHGFLRLDGPATTLRPQTLVLESRHLEWLDDLGIGLAELLGDRRDLDQSLAEASGVDFVTPVKEQIADLLDGLRRPVTEVDANLARPLERTREQAIGALEQLAGKLAAAAARTDEIRRRRVDTLRELCLPHGALQERVLSTAYFPGKYGTALAEAYWQQMDLDGRNLQVIRL